ncbi:RluA family pseudouridine synthase [bacterium]|nr:RluA family pseudouridine synthase [bacterium]
MPNPLTLIVRAEFAGMRADRALAALIPGLSRRAAADLCRAGLVTRAGRRLRPGDALSEGDAIAADLAPVIGGIAPDDFPLDVLYQDDALVAVNKPAGRHTVPLRPGDRGTLAQALAARYPEMAGAGGDPREGGVCHRLDLWTSGVLVAARTANDFAAVRAAFGAGSIRKTYLAIVAGAPPDAFDVDAPIGHPSRRAPRVAVGGKGRGVVPARTRFAVIERVGETAIVRAYCATGAMHQVRAHAAHAGFPLVGDTLYGGPPHPAGRYFLHAHTIELPHPRTGETMSIHAPPPEEFPVAIGEMGVEGRRTKWT